MNDKGRNTTALSLAFDTEERNIFDKAYEKMCNEKSAQNRTLTKKEFVRNLCLRYLNTNSMEHRRGAEDIKKAIDTKQALIDEITKSIQSDMELLERYE